MKRRRVMYLLVLLLYGCSGLEQSEQDTMRKANAKAEVIFRRQDETFCTISTPKHRVRELYSWENRFIGNQRMITKEYFRCRGDAKNFPRIIKMGAGEQTYYDCGGYAKHSLPTRGEKEYIYPILIELLNHVQKITEKKVVITCGHRCPAHESYAQLVPSYALSKHVIGAEVDFYVEGMEDNPRAIVEILKGYYAQHRDKDFFSFIKTPHSEENKEVSFKIIPKGEGRDLDNNHPYPYITIQVKYDRGLQKKITYTLKEANSCYLRW
jgi:hypothetical protein